MGFITARPAGPTSDSSFETLAFHNDNLALSITKHKCIETDTAHSFDQPFPTRRQPLGLTPQIAQLGIRQQVPTIRNGGHPAPLVGALEGDPPVREAWCEGDANPANAAPLGTTPLA